MDQSDSKKTGSPFVAQLKSDAEFFLTSVRENDISTLQHLVWMFPNTVVVTLNIYNIEDKKLLKTNFNT